MAAEDGAVTDELVSRMLERADWADEHVSAEKDLIGSRKFKRQWARHGAENVRTVGERWFAESAKASESAAELQRKEECLNRLRSLEKSPEPAPTTDGTRFAALGDHVCELQDQLDQAERELAESTSREEATLEPGHRRIEELRAQLDGALQEQQQAAANLRNDERRRDALRTELKDLTDKRDQLRAKTESVRQLRDP